MQISGGYLQAPVQKLVPSTVSSNPVTFTIWECNSVGRVPALNRRHAGSIPAIPTKHKITKGDDFHAATMYSKRLPTGLSHRTQRTGLLPLLRHRLSPDPAGFPVSPGYIRIFSPGGLYRYAECGNSQCISQLPGLASILPPTAIGCRLRLVPAGCPGILPTVSIPGDLGGYHHQLGCPAAASGIFPDVVKISSLTIPYLNHAYDQLDEQSTPVLRGAGKTQLDPAGIPVGEICLLTVMSTGKAETANRKPVSQNCSHQKVRPFRLQ